MKYCVATFYRFTPLEGLEGLKQGLLALSKNENIKGTILIGPEGINATVAGDKKAIQILLSYLQKMQYFQYLEVKFSTALRMPFRRIKVRIKKEIVTLGVNGLDPLNKTGKHIAAALWNEVLEDPDVVVLDTRNIYESKIGTFKGAINPALESFSDFPDFVRENLDPSRDKKVAMFCTGGIRCEKAAAWMLNEGFENVMQLDGGILKYLEKTPESESLWQGECYVFDGRMAVNAKLEKGQYDICPSCRWPVSEDDNTHKGYEEGVSCAQCYDKLPESRFQRSRERKKQMELAEKRQTAHLGANYPKND